MKDFFEYRETLTEAKSFDAITYNLKYVNSKSTNDPFVTFRDTKFEKEVISTLDKLKYPYLDQSSYQSKLVHRKDGMFKDVANLMAKKAANPNGNNYKIEMEDYGFPSGWRITFSLIGPMYASPMILNMGDEKEISWKGIKNTYLMIHKGSMIQSNLLLGLSKNPVPKSLNLKSYAEDFANKIREKDPKLKKYYEQVTK